MICKSDITSLKANIGDKLGQKIIVKGSLGRSKPFEKEATIEKAYPNIFVVKYDVFVEICKQLHIEGNNPSEKYLALKHKIEKGYTSLHELLYKELVQKG